MAVCLSSDVWWSGGDGANVPLGGVDVAVGWRRRRWRRRGVERPGGGSGGPGSPWCVPSKGVKGISCGPVQVFSECRQVGLQ